MAGKLGTSAHPAVVRVQTLERAQEVMALCSERGWKAVVGIEPDEPEDLADLERLLYPLEPARVQKVGRNDPCPCGSGRKHKKCCGAKS